MFTAYISTHLHPCMKGETVKPAVYLDWARFHGYDKSEDGDIKPRIWIAWYLTVMKDDAPQHRETHLTLAARALLDEWDNSKDPRILAVTEELRNLPAMSEYKFEETARDISKRQTH